MWNDCYGSGGGGVSSDFAGRLAVGARAWARRPPWRQCAALGRSSCREVPDVSAVGRPAHGYAIYFGGALGAFDVGGTSAASPLWAALWP